MNQHFLNRMDVPLSFSTALAFAFSFAGAMDGNPQHIFAGLMIAACLLFLRDILRMSQR